MPRPKTVYQMGPKRVGAKLRLAVYQLPGDFADMEAFAADLDGEVCGYLHDSRRPEVVTLQIQEGCAEVDLAWVRGRLFGEMSLVNVVLRQLPLGGCLYYGTASTRPDEPDRFHFSLAFTGFAP